MSILGALFGTDASDAANAAAARTEANQLAASKAAMSYAAGIPAQYNQVSQAYNPWTSAGTSALTQLQGGLGLGGPGSQQQFTAAYQGLPGYQSGLATGQQAAERGLNAGGGGLNSGAAMKALYRYGSDYENQRSGDYLNRLQGLSGQGLTATGAQTGLQGQGLGQGNQIYSQGLGYQYGAAPTIGQGQVAGAQAEQSALGNLLNVGGYLGGSFLGGRNSLPSWGSAGGSSPVSAGSYGGIPYPIFG